VRLLSAGGGLVYIQGKNGKYMTVIGGGFEENK
jgi:hypothetical protein